MQASLADLWLKVRGDRLEWKARVSSLLATPTTAPRFTLKAQLMTGDRNENIHQNQMQKQGQLAII